MKEKPIIFSAEMVLAILDGRKTQTRRVIKNHLIYDIKTLLDGRVLWRSGPGGDFEDAYPIDDLRQDCPYGQRGDRLWVRETWMPETEQGCPTGERIYKASDKPEPDGDMPLRWRSPIFMPRWASRITLEITGVRVERVQNIDVLDECGQHVGKDAWLEGFRCPNPTAAFMVYWDSLNAKRGFGWAVNPWVWIIEFRRIEEGRMA